MLKHLYVKNFITISCFEAEFKNQLTIGPDMTDEEVRNTTRDNAQRIIEMSVDRSQVDRNTGQYFASIL